VNVVAASRKREKPTFRLHYFSSITVSRNLIRKTPILLITASRFFNESHLRHYVINFKR